MVIKVSLIGKIKFSYFLHLASILQPIKVDFIKRENFPLHLFFISKSHAISLIMLILIYEKSIIVVMTLSIFVKNKIFNVHLKAAI